MRWWCCCCRPSSSLHVGIGCTKSHCQRGMDGLCVCHISGCGGAICWAPPPSWSMSWSWSWSMSWVWSMLLLLSLAVVGSSSSSWLLWWTLKETCDVTCHMKLMINKQGHVDASHHVICTSTCSYVMCLIPFAVILGLVLSKNPQDCLQSSGIYPHRTPKVGWYICQYWVLGILRNPQESVGDNKDLESGGIKQYQVESTGFWSHSTRLHQIPPDSTRMTGVRQE